jgi:hypothetical protein
MSDKKPVIFISYSHKDEPEKPSGGEIQWLSFVRTYLQPAVKHGIVDLFDDQRLTGGAELDPEIEKRLRTCDIFLLLISAHSLASNYIVDKEISITRERQSKGEDIHFYPLLLTPTPKVALNKLSDLIIRPRDAKPLSSSTYNERIQQMTDAADEIAAIAAEITSRKAPSPKRPPQPTFVHITSLPETAYEHLVGRELELKRLNEAWTDPNVSILSLVAEGGAGKSALVNEWLTQLRTDDYRGAEMVLGWSFYNQGTKERATSSDEFLNWAIGKLGIKIETSSAGAKGEAVAEAMIKRRVLLVLDGCEPLQHGLDKRQGELKDTELRALLRRFAATSPGTAHGLVVLTSRLVVKDIARWRDSAALVVDVGRLSDEAGAALLRDNSVWGTNKELKAATQDFGGHPLALGLLASFLKETQTGDVRRRDHIGAYFVDKDNPRHDHAGRVMESYEKEWLAGQPILLAIMDMVGLFDRPATRDCMRALRNRPVIEGITEQVIDLDDRQWQRAITRLRESRLLSPVDPFNKDTLDAHPLVREWFGNRLSLANEAAFRAAHGRLYEHLRDTTAKEGEKSTLEEDLPSLYQAIAHGCRAGRHQEVLQDIYLDRIHLRRVGSKLGGGSNLAALSWFFEEPYELPAATLLQPAQSMVLNHASYDLYSLGRLNEAVAAQRVALSMTVAVEHWINATRSAINLSSIELLAGDIADAVITAARSVTYADHTGDIGAILSSLVCHGDGLCAAGQRSEAELTFADAERRQQEDNPSAPLLYALRGYLYCDLLITTGNWAAVCDRATRTMVIAQRNNWVCETSLDILSFCRGCLGLALTAAGTSQSYKSDNVERAFFDEAIEGLRAVEAAHYVPRGLLARAAFCRSIGDWEGASRDLDEVEEIAELGPMKLFLCDMALERVRLAFAKIEAFAPLNGLINEISRKLVDLEVAQAERLKEEASKNLVEARKLINECGYHRRDEELAELEAVLRGNRKFSDLPPRV